MNVDEVDPTHHIVARTADNLVECKLRAAEVAIERGSAVALLFRRQVLDEYPFIEDELEDRFTRTDGEQRLWPAYDEAAVEYHGRLPEGREVIEAFLRIAVEQEFWVFSELVVFEDESWLLHLPAHAGHTQVANVNIDPAHSTLEPELSDGLEGLPAALVPAGTIASWSGGEHWFEIRAHQLCVYEEDPTDATSEKKEYYMTHRCYDLTDVEHVLVQDGERTIRLSWDSEPATSAIERVFSRALGTVQPDPPSELVISDRSAFERAAAVLTEIVDQLWSDLSTNGNE